MKRSTEETLSVNPDLMVAPVRECFMKNDEFFHKRSAAYLLNIQFFFFISTLREKQLSSSITVRPTGKRRLDKMCILSRDLKNSAIFTSA